MFVLTRLVVVLALFTAFGARAQDDDDGAATDAAVADDEDATDDEDEQGAEQASPRLPAASQKAGAAGTDARKLEAEDVDSHGCFGFGGRIIGVPALLIGGTLLGTGLHALVVATTLNQSGLNNAGGWTDFGATIGIGVSALAIVIGEIALAAGAFGDMFTAFDLTAAEAEGSGFAWTRLATWEVAAHLGALGAGLTVGGVLSIIVTIVMPQVFVFDSRGQGAYDDLFTLGLGTAVLGVVAVLAAAALAGISVWLDGATTTAYKRAATEPRTARAAIRRPLVARGSLNERAASPAMAY